MNAPNGYDRRILVAVCGMTPQVLTETLYALLVAAAEPFLVNEMRLVTTAVGRDQALNALIVDGQLAALCEEFDLGEIRFDESCVEVVRDADGQELRDILTPEHNRLAADAITDAVRRLAALPDATLHVSLAGGRKTMGYYIGYALSLYGRAQDRLSHVLVEEGFESNREFFYPTRKPRAIKTRNELYLDSSKARVMLAEIPFVRLRETLPSRLLEERASFSEAVRWSNLDTQPARLEIDLREGTVVASGERIELSRKELAMYTVFARAALDGEFIEGQQSSPTLRRDFAEELARLHGLRELPEETRDLLRALEDADDPVDSRTLAALQREKPIMGNAYMLPVLSDIRSAFEVALGKRLAERYVVQAMDRRKGSVRKKISFYGLMLGREHIHIRD